jgi:hypothetical protein
MCARVSLRTGTSPITGTTNRRQYDSCSSRCRSDHARPRAGRRPGSRYRATSALPRAEPSDVGVPADSRSTSSPPSPPPQPETSPSCPDAGRPPTTAAANTPTGTPAHTPTPHTQTPTPPANAWRARRCCFLVVPCVPRRNVDVLVPLGETGGRLSLQALLSTNPQRVRVETMGLEPTTPCLQSRCSSQLSYVPGAGGSAYRSGRMGHERAPSSHTW